MDAGAAQGCGPLDTAVRVQVRLKTRLDYPPDKTFDILTEPDNTHIFRNIKVGWPLQSSKSYHAAPSNSFALAEAINTKGVNIEVQ